MVNDGELAIGLLDFQLGSGGLDAQGVVVGGIDDHGVDEIKVLESRLRYIGWKICRGEKMSW